MPTIDEIHAACQEARPDLKWRIRTFKDEQRVQGRTEYPCPYVHITPSGDGVRVDCLTGAPCWAYLPSLDHLQAFLKDCRLMMPWGRESAHLTLLPVHTGLMSEPDDSGSRNPPKPCFWISDTMTHVYTLEAGDIHLSSLVDHNPILRSFLAYLAEQGLV